MANGSEHLFDAAAFALHGKLTHPIHHEIKHTAHSKLSAEGGYVHERSEKYRAEGVISYESAYTHVAGNADKKGNHAWSTISSSVIERFNIMDVVTADRMVAQILTYHPLNGYVPEVIFLGTRFENLRIAGHPVKVDLRLDPLGATAPANGYLSDNAFRNYMTQQRAEIWRPGPPQEVKDRYPQNLPTPAIPGSIETSLVYKAEKVTGDEYPGTNFGHVIVVPYFGKIYLATLKVTESDPAPGAANVPMKTRLTLKMIEFEMGSMGGGSGSAGGASNNGNNPPG